MKLLHNIKVSIENGDNKKILFKDSNNNAKNSDETAENLISALRILEKNNIDIVNVKKLKILEYSKDVIGVKVKLN